jgi:rRNA maturation endonuclease Nob1
MTGGTYKLDCHTCSHTVTVPAIDGTQACPLCGAPLHIQWNAARAEITRIPQQRQEATPAS